MFVTSALLNVCESVFIFFPLYGDVRLTQLNSVLCWGSGSSYILLSPQSPVLQFFLFKCQCHLVQLFYAYSTLRVDCIWTSLQIYFSSLFGFFSSQNSGFLAQMQKDFSPAGNLIATHFGLSPNPGCHITKGFCIIDFIVANTHKNSLDFFFGIRQSRFSEMITFDDGMAMIVITTMVMMMMMMMMT